MGSSHNPGLVELVVGAVGLLDEVVYEVLDNNPKLRPLLEEVNVVVKLIHGEFELERSKEIADPRVEKLFGLFFEEPVLLYLLDPVEEFFAADVLER